MPTSVTSPTAYRLLDNPDGVDWKFYGHSGKGEYFLVENREPVGFDAGLPGCGLLIYHVDETVTRTNDANADDAHRLIDVEEASGTNPLDDYGYRGSASDPFPGSTGQGRLRGRHRARPRRSTAVIRPASACTSTPAAPTR